MTQVYLRNRRDPIVTKEAPLALARRVFQPVPHINLKSIDGLVHELHPDAIRDIQETP